ncbi:MAG: alanine racemase [Oscillospiraceae bacterium]|nr:alanine racemase [Oscillospiraceae bacterium]
MQHYHRTWAEIDLNAIEENVQAARAKLPLGTRLCCVIKADGYGHGASELAKFLGDKADYYAVAVLEEALTLRQGGITKPMLILGYTSPSQAAVVVKADLTQTVFTFAAAEALSAAAAALGKAVKVHIALDTGMNRIGFPDTAESIHEIQRIHELPFLEIEGLFTHFARADEIDKTSANLQYARYAAFAEKLAAAGVPIPIKHVCNSAGIMEMPQKLDMCRLGISLYGLYPSDEVDPGNMEIRPAMTWKTHVVHIKTVPAGEGISYGHTHITRRETVVATLPVGYADGYPRALSNKGHVLIHGQYAPILGRVCMDQFMVDITDIPGVQVEDAAVLIGRMGEKEITMEEIGAASASFNYETACRVGQRVPRLYLYNGETVGWHSVFVTENAYG